MAVEMTKRRSLWDRAYAFDEGFATPIERLQPPDSRGVRLALAWLAGYRAGRRARRVPQKL